MSGRFCSTSSIFFVQNFIELCCDCFTFWNLIIEEITYKTFFAVRVRLAIHVIGLLALVAQIRLEHFRFGLK